ncbi:MAG: YggS family pyridoxal phosphate-dependent enzyme [Blastococcus sp.]
MAGLEENLRAVRARIDTAARAAGRDPASVALLAVSKTWPARDVRALLELGQRDFGENRAQELVEKARQLEQMELVDVPVRWHFIGQLQRNKAAAVARLGAVVHSVDRLALAQVLDRVGQDSDRPVDVLLQVDLGGAARGSAPRGGADPAAVPGLADAVSDCPGLHLRGLMAVAPLGADPGAAFGQLAELAARVRADHPGAVELSAGMSGDLEAAVAAGATVVRVGTALFGARHLPSGEDPSTPATPVTPVTEAT